MTRRTVKVVDIRHQRNLTDFLPIDADEYREGLLDILERMDTGYWPHIGIEKGWYGLVVELSKNLSNIDNNFKINHLRTRDNELDIFVTYPDVDDDKADAITSLIINAVVKSRAICGKCGEMLGNVTTCRYCKK